jgi:glycoprotein endo-alpha-1,2-mannosidase
LTTVRLATLLTTVCLLATAAAQAQAQPTRVAIFFYPWYGTPSVDGLYRHWQRADAAGPAEIASEFYPARGLYSSGDPVVLRAQMQEIASAGVDQIVTSWWGWGSVEDVRLPAVVAAARAAGLDVAIHLEPYTGRTPDSTYDDIEHLRGFGIRDFYLYGPTQDGLPWDWGVLNQRLQGVRLFAQTGGAAYAAAWGFDGLYTYDILNYGGNTFERLCALARRLKMICSPSVGPGYDARRAVADPRVKLRRHGATYDSMWGAALKARADLITITSYNEWHEGSQIEPARPQPGYRGYDGAWGRVGKTAERAYLDRTALWSARFARQRR